jgi:hypothetical protein
MSSTTPNRLQQLLGWILPYRAYVFLYHSLPARREARRMREAERVPLGLAQANREFRERHRGERCFILCNGPSVNEQNLRMLRGETVFSVSNGYHHPDYREFQPRYHVVPQITYGKVTRTDVIAWFREMDAGIGSATLFLASSEQSLVRESALFAGRDVRYVYLRDAFADHPGDEVIDIAAPTARVQSVAILALMIALYMGFKEIYLLGTEHDHFRTGRYEYFYTPTAMLGKDKDVERDGRVTTPLHDDFRGLAELWSQYRRLREIAERRGATIYNATRGGALDEFPRVELESLFVPAGA